MGSFEISCGDSFRAGESRDVPDLFEPFLFPVFLHWFDKFCIARVNTFFNSVFMASRSFFICSRMASRLSRFWAKDFSLCLKDSLNHVLSSDCCFSVNFNSLFRRSTMRLACCSGVCFSRGPRCCAWVQKAANMQHATVRNTIFFILSFN